MNRMGVAHSGLIVRHLVLPEGLSGTKKIMHFIAREISPHTYISLMAQYFPAYQAGQFPPLSRRINREEYREALQAFEEEGLGDGWFQKERYPYSLGKTYEYFSQKNGKEINPELKKKIEELGWQVFRQIPELVDGVYQVLDILSKKYFLILATLGDPQVQGKKLQLTDLKKYFSAVYVLRYKNVEEYQNILTEHKLDKKDTWIIGNSVRSDLNPGLKLGLNCILIPTLTWKFEEEEPLSENYLKLDSLKEVLNYL
ncbi:unnamed protein product [marine sediment metagenome]|uniref:HAD family hydrolase n=1 Tax=marine sediment metagenome TaxID=412755 RepID=X0ZZV2_9ZZZZ